jgi:hypothetical protein
MGKTFNTRPLSVRREVYVEHHDHRNGECNLAPLETFLKMERQKRWSSYRNGDCMWWPDWHKMRDTRCSCPMCRDPWWADFKKRQKAGPMPTLDDY